MISTAINEKKKLRFVYSGEIREVEPYFYGITVAGNKALRAFQINKGWRIFEESKMTQLEILEINFNLRAEYNPNDEGFSSFICRV